MSAIQHGLEQSQSNAMLQQATATSAQWLVYKTRASLGSEVITPGRQQGGDVTVSKLEGARPADVETNVKPIVGVLDIDVANHGVVRAAYANGIARATVDRIAVADLRALKVPMRIVLGRMDARTLIVTLDEAGRIRATGDFGLLVRWNRGVAPRTEDEAHPAAVALAEQVLAVPLAKHGVRVHTDDASVP